MQIQRIYWLIGLIHGDGYANDRKIEVYNSSISILKEAVAIFNGLKVQNEKIKVDVYSGRPNGIDIKKWSETLQLPSENFKARLNTSPWKERKDKVRLRIHSKRLVSRLLVMKPYGTGYARGLFDAEASVDIKGYIEFKQKARPKGIRITKSLHKFLSSGGMGCTPLRIKDDKGIKKDIYFYVKNLEKFAKEVNFIDIEKQRKLAILLRIRAQNYVRKTLPSKIEIEKQNLWDVMDEFEVPYHRIRRQMYEAA